MDFVDNAFSYINIRLPLPFIFFFEISELLEFTWRVFFTVLQGTHYTVFWLLPWIKLRIVSHLKYQDKKPVPNATLYRYIHTNSRCQHVNQRTICPLLVWRDSRSMDFYILHVKKPSVPDVFLWLLQIINLCSFCLYTEPNFRGAVFSLLPPFCISWQMV